MRDYSSRKCIVSKNIAETSLTIDGVIYVIDAGLVVQSHYNPRAGLNKLATAPISQAAAYQRSSRAGRTRPGMCFRVYEEATFNNVFVPSTPPGILENEIVQQVLPLKSLGYSVAKGYISANGMITREGRMAVKLPVHSVWMNAFREAHGLGCGLEMVGIAALMSTENSIFLRPYTTRYGADIARSRFFCPFSDHITHLNALHAFSKVQEQGEAGLDRWCSEAFLSRRVLEEACRIRLQLKTPVSQVLRAALRSTSFGLDDYELKIRKALARSFFYRSAFRQPGLDLYKMVHDSHPAGIHPDSALVGQGHEWVIFDAFIHTGKQYMQNTTAVDPDWLVDLDYFREERFAGKRNGMLRHPEAIESISEARAKRSQNAG
ncbi:hypothetical protein FZEAL_527 [Fusarium zealandicum]|uniref:Helicase C-terminal domain-containing protein n=1 Tax=Fusarium zealandicum TaxID=1053134 RepID=A0A8H4UV02_9HYPO|nr:hypothetical protein FZEAL_527 [Fusarium zealandicum]